MIVKHYCPYCRKLISVDKMTEEDRKGARIHKENMQEILKVLGKECRAIHY